MKNEKLIQITCLLVLLGRAIQHLFFDSPIRGILYSALLMKTPLGLFNINFNDYINSPNLDLYITRILLVIGLLFLILSLFFFYLKPFHQKIKNIAFYSATFLLIVVSFAYFKDKSFSVGQFFEYSSQMFLPLFFVIKKRSRKLFLQVIIAITFICHGLYAIGYYPIPGSFVQMIISTLNCSNQSAMFILKIVGLLDFLFAIGIFIPKLDKPFLLYGFVWGFITTFARIYTNFYSDFALSTFSYWLFEFLVRTPHFIIPFILFKIAKKHSYYLSTLQFKY